MAEFVKAAATGEIEPGSGKDVSVGGKDLAIFNVDGTYYCTDNSCLHRGGPLGEGFVQGSTVVCPWHGWQFEIPTGACKTNPKATLKCYEVKVDGDEILVAV